MKGSVLVVDDRETIRLVLASILMEEGYLVTTAGDGGEALEKVTALLPDVVISDIKLPGMDGITLHRKIREIDRELPVILITAYGSIEAAVAAIKQGAYDYLTKPIDHDRLKILVQRAMERRRFVNENTLLKRELQDRHGFAQMIGSSRKIREVFETIRTVAASQSTVIILGESGTGKELVARAIHYQSPRKDKPLIGINCAALSEGLLESELFGHEKGAYTGATARHIGRFEQADRGTLFLDEIGDISANLQIKLLRVLQERRFERVGGRETVHSNFRLVAATNKDLRSEALRGTFREDLYYRLSVITIKVPPLRERREDIPLLVNHFLEKYCQRDGKAVPAVTPEAMAAMLDYRWPGNIRELENCIERAVVVCRGDSIDLSEICTSQFLPPAPPGSAPTPPDPSEVTAAGELDLHRHEKELIIAALKQSGGNKAEAARLLNVHRRTIYNRIKKYSLALLKGE